MHKREKNEWVWVNFSVASFIFKFSSYWFLLSHFVVITGRRQKALWVEQILQTLECGAREEHEQSTRRRFQDSRRFRCTFLTCACTNVLYSFHQNRSSVVLVAVTPVPVSVPSGDVNQCKTRQFSSKVHCSSLAPQTMWRTVTKNQCTSVTSPRHTE